MLVHLIWIHIQINPHLLDILDRGHEPATDLLRHIKFARDLLAHLLLHRALLKKGLLVALVVRRDYPALLRDLVQGPEFLAARLLGELLLRDVEGADALAVLAGLIKVGVVIMSMPTSTA